MIVMPDADMDQAADALTGAAFGSAGERCMAISVAIAVGDGTADALIARMTRAHRRAQGRRRHRGRRRDRPAGHRRAPRQGRRLHRTGSQGRRGTLRRCAAQGDAAQRQRLLPRRHASSTTSSRRCASIAKRSLALCSACCACPAFSTALDLVNDHEFGNGVCIFTRDGDTARAFANQVQAGMVGINVPIPVPMAFHSFGGWKRSLFGDHNVHGMEGVRFYTRVKTVTGRWPTGIRAGVSTSPCLTQWLEVRSAISAFWSRISSARSSSIATG